jgi:hypothetical protein
VNKEAQTAALYVLIKESLARKLSGLNPEQAKTVLRSVKGLGTGPRNALRDAFASGPNVNTADALKKAKNKIMGIE